MTYRAWMGAGALFLGGTLQLACGSSDESKSDPTGASVAGTAGAAPGEASGGHSGSGSGGTGSGGAGIGGSPAVGSGTLIDAAVLIGSCMGDDGISRNLSDLQFPEHKTGLSLLSAVDCLAESSDGCAAVTRCLGVDYNWVSDPTPRATCTGDSLTVVEDFDATRGIELTFDCAAMGSVCDETRFCAPPASAACDPDTYLPSCDGEGRPVSCPRGSEIVGPRCADLGLRCVDGACQGTEGACFDSFPSRDLLIDYHGTACEGDVLVSCVAGGIHRRDCTKLGAGYGCHYADDAYFCGKGSECRPGNTPMGYGASESACNGTLVRFCDGGVLRERDCRALGFSECQESHPLAAGAACGPSFYEKLMPD